MNACVRSLIVVFVSVVGLSLVTSASIQVTWQVREPKAGMAMLATFCKMVRGASSS